MAIIIRAAAVTTPPRLVREGSERRRQITKNEKQKNMAKRGGRVRRSRLGEIAKEEGEAEGSVSLRRESHIH